MDFRYPRPRPNLGKFWSGLLMAAVFTVFAFTISACDGGSGSNGSSGSGFQEGKGFPGDTRYADSVIRPYYVNNGLVDPTVPPGTVLPATVSNQALLTANVPNQGGVGTCASVAFAQLVYGTDVEEGATNPLLDNVQYSYLFARFLQSNEQGGEKGWPKDDGSFAYTNFRALTTESYRQTYSNGFLPIDGEEDKVMHATGVFFPFANGKSPNRIDRINAPETEGPPNLDSFWNKINLWESLSTGPTTLTMTIRRAAFSPSSLDVKAIVADDKLVWFAIDTVDSKHQWNDKTSFSGSGVLELPYTKPEKPEQGGGHAMVIVGYDDAGYGKYKDGAGAFVGAFKVRNSWGRDFGDGGYWYLPYSIVDGVAGNSEHDTYPLFYDENFVYISAMAHD